MHVGCVGCLLHESAPFFDGKGQRGPVQQLAHLGYGRGEGGAAQNIAGRAKLGFAVHAHIKYAVGVLHDALEAMFGEDDGQAEVSIELDQGIKHFFGRLGVKLRCRLVQHQHAGLEGEHCRDCHALAFAAGKGADAPPAQVFYAEGMERSLPLACA